MDGSRTTGAAAETDRRGAPRKRALKGARLVYGNFALSCDCLIRSMSEMGARLRIDRSIGVPQECYLLIPSDLSICKVRIIWHKGEEFGVQFLEPMRNPKLDPDQRIARLVV